MLTKISIQNLKGIKTFAIEDLSRVNLIIGKNDSGKSTILEAINFMFHELYGDLRFTGILSRRTESFTGLSELWYGYNTKEVVRVEATFNSINLVWEIVYEQAPSTYQLMTSFQQVYGSKPIAEHLIGTSVYARDFSFSKKYKYGQHQNRCGNTKRPLGLFVFSNID